MYILICVPNQQKIAFASFTDQHLSRELDWNLLFVEEELTNPLDMVSSARRLVFDSVIASRSSELQKILPSYTIGSISRRLLQTEFSVWCFHLSPLGLLEDVEHIIDLLHSFGCYVGLTFYPVIENRYF